MIPSFERFQFRPRAMVGNARCLLALFRFRTSLAICSIRNAGVTVAKRKAKRRYRNIMVLYIEVLIEAKRRINPEAPEAGEYRDLNLKVMNYGWRGDSMKIWRPGVGPQTRKILAQVQTRGAMNGWHRAEKGALEVPFRVMAPALWPKAGSPACQPGAANGADRIIPALVARSDGAQDWSD